MAIGVNWKEIWAPVWGPVWTQTPPVEVPDVVGLTQAQGTSDLEAAGFVVAAETAYSSVVAAGLIISQDPAAGSTPGTGATVTITVSLGEAPQPPQQDTSGGWAFFFRYEREREERRRKRREQEEREEEARRIEDETTREIAKLLRAQEARDAERAELERLQALADTFAGQPLGLPARTRAALLRASERRTVNALQQMQREIERMFEEEEATALAMLMMDD